jgi:hypothetical protein
MPAVRQLWAASALGIALMLVQWLIPGAGLLGGFPGLVAALAVTCTLGYMAGTLGRLFVLAPVFTLSLLATRALVTWAYDAHMVDVPGVGRSDYVGALAGLFVKTMLMAVGIALGGVVLRNHMDTRRAAR